MKSVTAPDLLAQLHDIHLPAAVSWWPPAPGWWMLLLTLLCVASLSWWLHRRRSIRAREPRYSHREIMTAAWCEFEALELSLATGKKGEIIAATGLSQLLRRLAIRMTNTGIAENFREDISGLTGSDWLQWLDARWKDDGFCNGVGRQLLDLPYRRDGEEGNIPALLELVRNWLKAQKQ